MRYFIYMILLNMFGNIIVFVPSVLVRERFDGAVMAMLAGTILSTLLMFIFVRALETGSQKGIPELMDILPSFVRSTLLFFYAIIWLSAGAITLIGFNDLAIRFINPDMQGIWMILFFSSFVAVVLIYLNTEKLLYLLELVLFLNMPLILFILYRSVLSSDLSLDAMLEVGTYVTHPPSWSAMSAVTYTYTGYANMIVFRRVFKKPVRVRQIWYLPIVGIANLCVTFFIPIGMLGADSASAYQFPWVMTADSLWIKLGPVERLTSIFLLLYVSISVMSVIIHWHVSLVLFREIGMIRRWEQRMRNPHRVSAIMLAGFVGLMLVLERRLIEDEIFRMGEIWLNLRMPIEIMLVIMVFWLARRNRSGTAERR